METKNELQLTLTGIIVSDESSGQFTAFFAEFPEAIACGETKEAAHQNLFQIFTIMLEDKRK